jgi:DNA-binding protein HU-beta
MASGLTKTQLVRHLAEKTELPNKTVAAFLEQLADEPIQIKAKTVVKFRVAKAAKDAIAPKKP